MSDQGEKACPLCAEEMDLTDQQLRPCKCGYQICVWCWHHIMDMAEKDETEGRCPACRTPYDKEKIVGMAANCERLVSEVNMERKKSQKSKTKPSEERKQLSSVRVIQRNLVYIVGLPLNLADEDLLQHKEYFGQYGKVLKVSKSRTAACAIQQFPNSTCSVYITYSKEEEAIRCIQSVHGFVLDGRSLKACFGTTKYCHAWLRNVPCSNPDCLYLHEIGSQEDSFTKDEIISAYTRSRVQQITGATNNLQRHSGNVLPPPADDYSKNSSAKSIEENASNNMASVPKSSPPNGTSGRSVALPAAASWGMRASNQQSVPNSASLNGSSNKQRPGLVNGILAFSSAVTNTTQAVSHINVLKKPSLEEDGQTTIDKSKPGLPKSLKHSIPIDSRSKRPTTPDREPRGDQISCSLASTYDGGLVSTSSITTNSFEERSAKGDESKHNICAGVASMSIDRNSRNENSGLTMLSGTLSDQGLIRSPGNEGLQPHYAEQCRDHHPLKADGRAVASPNGNCASRPDCDWRSDMPYLVGMNKNLKLEEDILSFDNRQLNDSEVMSPPTYMSHNSANSICNPNHSGLHSSQNSEVSGVVNSSSISIFLDNRDTDRSLLSNGSAEKPILGSFDSRASVEHPLFANEGKRENWTGEDHIISNILSLDFDPWNDTLTSPQNFDKLLGETGQQATSMKLSSPLKPHHTHQSRFSFARQEESNNNQAFEVEPYSIFGQLSTDQPFLQDPAASRGPHLDKLGIRSGFISSYSDGLDDFSTSPSVFSSSKISVSRAQISAPPGFSNPRRSPPPGFSSTERMDQTFDATSGTRLLDSTSLLRNENKVPLPNGNVGGGSGDIEFMDPAILAVGRGRLQGDLVNVGLDMRSGFSPPVNTFENDATLQLLMQRSLSAQQGLRYPDIRDNFSSSLNDSYGITSRLMDQSHGRGLSGLSHFTQLPRQQSSNSLMSNDHWDRWNEVQGGNSLGMVELLRNERLGFSNNLYNGYEEKKFQMPSSGDLYNRTYRM